MTPGLRWRIVTLQALLTVVLAFTAGFCYWASGFTHDNVKHELSSQKIAMPAGAGLKGLLPEDVNALKPFAGQTMSDGLQAQAYANHYIARHIAEMGYTYSEISAKYLANPSNKQVADQRQTIFMGTMLRGSLLQAYAWWEMGTYALYAAIGLTIAAAAVFGALLFELFFADRYARERESAKVASGRLAGTTA